MILDTHAARSTTLNTNVATQEKKSKGNCRSPILESVPVAQGTLASSALMRYSACEDFERAHQANSLTHCTSVIHELSENGHTTTFDILSRAANTLTHPTTWASNVMSLVSPTPTSENNLSISAATAPSTAMAAPPVPSVTCITPPMLTITEYNAFTDVTMTRRLSLTELSQPPYAPWPPRQTRAAFCGHAAACVSRTITAGEADPLRFMLPWVMDKRFMFPLPLDHQGRASFRSGRWWSRRNLGYEHIRPTPVHFVMRKKSTSSSTQAPAPLEDEEEEDSSNEWMSVENDVGDETLPSEPRRQGTLPAPAAGSSIMTIREAALAMARAGHERVVARRNSIPPAQVDLISSSQTHPDHVFAHVTDSDSDVDMDGDEAIGNHKGETDAEHRAQLQCHRSSPRRSYSPNRIPSIRGRSSSLRRVAVSADDHATPSNTSTDDLSSTASSPNRRIFAQRWHLASSSPGSTRSREQSLDGGSSQDSDDSDDSLGMDDHPEGASDHSSETSKDSLDSDDLDCSMTDIAAALSSKNGRCQLLGTVLEVEDGEDLMGNTDVKAGKKGPLRPGVFRPASFFIVDSPDQEVENRIRLNSSLELLHRTQAIENLQSHSKMPNMHTTAAMHASPGAVKEPSTSADVRAVKPSPFAAAVLARPIPKVHMSGLHGSVLLRRPGSLSATAAAPPLRTVFLDTTSIMDWEPQAF
ncbi:unnamed protein product [Tilletia laevis]|uniref:Uncharacterized protein n=3 Tax=Tilletia TaxID=13289 RepID=A0A8X7MYH8_9BASI|nr:hypothetical protein CF336_g436 [Tilletia laevis]KAE8205633.1 hypothetical protein CF328_g386 [Tilletia controversa]KAE8265383.1 hypothetical protein A4X03_0g311 [Tilletia caries]KAE8208696.1 hypothetical protein CF335_g231 [Tilletia laevis]KAE8254609.1 hypothetical protein A4X06_0g820 [Tilletia controversa]